MKKTLSLNNLAFVNFGSPAFPIATMGFLDALDKNNNAAWFNANRSRYQSEVVTPLKMVISSLETPLLALNSELDVSYKVNTTVMRINRDRRFAPNAAPYRNYIKVSFPLLGNKWSNDPVLGFGVFPSYAYVAFRNCGDKRKAFIERQDANLKAIPTELQRWIDQVNKECKLVLFEGEHDDIKPGRAVPKTARDWLLMKEPTIGRIWSREEIGDLGSSFNSVFTSTLCQLYFLKLTAVSHDVRNDVSGYFERIRRLRAA